MTRPDDGDLYLGGMVTPDGERTGDPLAYDPSDLTTHGVIVGMTGSGKTGLGIIYLEEALRKGIPCLVIDPKGDMTNLLLTFPALAPSDFLPWVDTAAAAKEGRTPDEEADAVARTWSDGLAGWELGGADIAALRERAGMTIYTPGSRAGVPLNVVGNLSVPALSWERDAEAIRDEIQGFVSGLLGLVGVDADPISSREHILLSNLIEHAWSSGTDLDLETLIAQIVAPPMRKLGVFEVDTFFPEKDRMAFAMQLNGLLASPSFAAWMDGQPVDIESLLWKDGTPQAAIIYLAHLSDAERQFIVTTMLSKLITWMRAQPGSNDLRVLTYMDEVFGFVPPTAQPPAKKPILTLLKQARAFGVGLLLSTQNPVDLDYKAMSNAGTWCIGRLQTERDKARILEALTAASGDTDLAAIDARVSALGKRQFLLHNTRDRGPSLFTTRWAMSYLRGPMTREEVSSVTSPALRSDTAPRRETTPDAAAVDRVALPSVPDVAAGVELGMLDPAAPWAGEAGFDPDGDHYEAAVAVGVEMRFDEARAGIDHTERWEAVATHLTSDPSDMVFVQVDHDPRDFLPVADDLAFAAPEAAISQSSWFTRLEGAVRDRLDADERMTFLRNRALDAVSRPGEGPEEFRSRLGALADEAADKEMAELRDRFAPRVRKAQRAYEAAVRDADAAASALDDARGDVLLGAGLDLLMGRRPKMSSSRSAEQRVRTAEGKVEKARAAYEDLGVDLEEELQAIRAEWQAKVDEIDELEVGLEADDIRITDVRLVWIRRSS